MNVIEKSMIALPKALLSLLALLLLACSPQAAESETRAPAVPAQPSAHPVSGLEVIPVTIETQAGSRVIRAEVAATPAEQARGLMFRTEMGPDEGMIFPREDDPRIASFWMRNTVLPLDLIFIGTDRRVLNIAANAVPYSEEPLRSDGIAVAVLELNGGRAAELGIAPGDTVSW